MMENISQMSMLEVAVKLMEQKGSIVNIHSLIKEVLELKGLTDEDGSLTTKLYLDITTSSKFVYMGDDNWDLKSRQSLDEYDKDGSAFNSKEYVDEDDEDDLEDDLDEDDLDDDYDEDDEDEDDDEYDEDSDYDDEDYDDEESLDDDEESEDDGELDDEEDVERYVEDDFDEDKYNDQMDDYEDLYEN